MCTCTVQYMDKQNVSASRLSGSHVNESYYFTFMFVYSSTHDLVLCDCILGRRHGLPQSIPNQRIHIDNRVARIDNRILWSPAEAVDHYRHTGGHITEPASFGIESILDNTKIAIRERAFTDLYPSFDQIFHALVNGNSRPFQEGLLFYCDITYRLSHS